MFDMEDICDALATRYAPGTIGTPTGALAMRSSYGQVPNSVPVTPAVIVMPKSGTVVYGAQAWDMTHQIDALFYYSKRQGDLPRSETQRQLWLPLLLSATHGKVALGLSGTVKSAMVTGYEFGVLIYGADEYDGIVIHYDVIVRESVSLTP